MVLAGDSALAAENARICQVFVTIEVIFDGGGLYLSPGGLCGQGAGVGVAGRRNQRVESSCPGACASLDSLTAGLSRKSAVAKVPMKEGARGSLDMSRVAPVFRIRTGWSGEVLTGQGQQDPDLPASRAGRHAVR